MTLHIANAALDLGVQRVVFATSNHVMGRYKDDPLWPQIGPGELTPELPPGTGTVWHTGVQPMDATAYATAKLMGERGCKEAAAGTPTQSGGGAAASDEAHARADRWFKEMWLSNRDFLQLFTANPHRRSRLAGWLCAGQWHV